MFIFLAFLYFYSLGITTGQFLFVALPYTVAVFLYYATDYGRKRNYFQFIILLCIYTAFICLFIIGTILSVQQLSESRRTVHQYRLMSFLGASRKDLQHGITGHLLIYFLLPLILPAVYSAAFLTVIIHMGTFTSTSIRYGVGMSILTLAVIYGIYFLVTNHQSRNMCWIRNGRMCRICWKDSGCKCVPCPNRDLLPGAEWPPEYNNIRRPILSY